MALFGTSLPVFLGLTLLAFGLAARATGAALAETWRPSWHLIPYVALMAAGSRFLDWSLFGGVLLSAPGYALTIVILLGIGFASYRTNEARKMVTQYPWLYTRVGPFSWRERRD
jgi:hypothetical protein